MDLISRLLRALRRLGPTSIFPTSELAAVHSPSYDTRLVLDTIYEVRERSLFQLRYLYAYPSISLE